MAEPRVIFDGVWKKFRRGERHDSLRDLIPATARKLFGRKREEELEEQEFWALKDVSFEVKPGEALGIIGPNGAGKSTALKLLTRILRPTKGHSALRGRVGALIEVAAGFHPDLTGRENIFLQGTIMGMKKAEISSRLDEIIDFSGVGPFIDTQVKRYSSGMNARLGFAIAAHLEPQVMVIDEVLSVGDLSFQRKCSERMSMLSRRGTAVVFVSHNLTAIAELCSRVLVLARGQAVHQGTAESAFSAYLSVVQAGSSRHGAGEPSFRLESAEMIGDRNAAATVRPGSQCRLLLDFLCLHDADDFNVGFEVERTRDLAYCYGATTQGLGQGLISAKRGDRICVSVDFRAHLLRGHYRVSVNLRSPHQGKYLFYGENVVMFTVVEDYSHDGVADLGVSMSVTSMNNS